MHLDTLSPRRPRYGFTLVGPDGTTTEMPPRPTRRRSKAPAGVMRAEIFDPTKVSLPSALQPKLDGVRATLSREGLLTRDRLRVTSVPAIEAVGRSLPDGVTLDGELWAVGRTLEEISADVRRQGPAVDNLVFNVFDLVDDTQTDMPFSERLDAAKALVGEIVQVPGRGHYGPDCVTVVPTEIAHSIEEIDAHYTVTLDRGFEGQIIRDLDAPYVHGRSAAVLKRKPFRDAEASIVAVVNGRKTGLPRTLVVRDLETGEKLTVAIQAMSDADRRKLAADPPEPGRLITYRWQDTASSHRRHRTLVMIHSPNGRL